MKAYTFFIGAVIAITCISADNPGADKYTLSKGYTVGIHGTSNLHDWDETVGVVTGEGTVSWNTDGTFDLGTMNIIMVVRSIKSTEGAMMNNNTYKALKADSNPEISFVLLTPLKSIQTGGHTLPAKINLTIAGVTKAIDMTVTASGQKNGSVTFEGSKTIAMTDYGIKPPVALLGTMKTGNNITIHFKTVFTR
jgi:polyisoprenoid-binding protein YceI